MQWRLKSPAYRSFAQAQIKKILNHCVTGLCEGNTPLTGAFPHKGPVTWKMFPFDDVIMNPESYDSPYPRSPSNTKEEEQYGKGFLWHFLIMKIWGRIAKYWCRSASVNERRITNPTLHDDVLKLKPFPRYWPFVRGIHRSPVNSPHKGHWSGALM